MEDKIQAYVNSFKGTKDELLTGLIEFYHTESKRIEKSYQKKINKLNKEKEETSDNLQYIFNLFSNTINNFFEENKRLFSDDYNE